MKSSIKKGIEHLKFLYKHEYAVDKFHGVIDERDIEEAMEIAVKNTLEFLRIRFCDGMHQDENNNKTSCRDALKKQSYKKRKCLNCEIIDEVLND